jgi:hypothetical protein
LENIRTVLEKEVVTAKNKSTGEEEKAKQRVAALTDVRRDDVPPYLRQFNCFINSLLLFFRLLTKSDSVNVDSRSSVTTWSCRSHRRSGR